MPLTKTMSLFGLIFEKASCFLALNVFFKALLFNFSFTVAFTNISCFGKADFTFLALLPKYYILEVSALDLKII